MFLNPQHVNKFPTAASETDSIITKKSKALKPADAETCTVHVTKKTTAATEVLTNNGKSATIGNLKPLQDAATARKQVTFLKDGTETRDKLSDVQRTKTAERPYISDSEDDDIAGDLDEEEVDDQTEALLKGFESEDDDEQVLQDKGYEAGQKIPKLDKKTKNQSKAAREASTLDKSGVIYVGRIPHGFYEQEMRQYFSQFGDISNLRLSRNRRTGSSRHFAFIEFESVEVAEIASKTMDNYLLFGHILKCKMVAPEQVHKNLWEGANKRFKRVPWNKMEGRKLKQGMNEEAWDKRVEREKVRRAKKKEILKSMGYEFENPRVKSAKEVAKEKEQSLITTTDGKPTQEKTKAIEAPHLGDASSMETAELGTKKKNKKKPGAGDALKVVLEHASNTQDPLAMDKISNKRESKDEKSEKATRELDGSVHSADPLSDRNADALKGEKAAKVKKSRKANAL